MKVLLTSAASGPQSGSGMGGITGGRYGPVERQTSDLQQVLQTVKPPEGVEIRPWQESDFTAIQALSRLEGWPTPVDRPNEALLGWCNSFPALVAVARGTIIGFARSVSDGFITTYVAEILVAEEWRGRGIASILLYVTQLLCPGTRLDLLATNQSRLFYERAGFRPFPGYRRGWAEVPAALTASLPR